MEPAVSKIKFATEAAITILRINDMIKLAPERAQKGERGVQFLTQLLGRA